MALPIFRLYPTERPPRVKPPVSYSTPRDEALHWADCCLPRVLCTGDIRHHKGRLLVANAVVGVVLLGGFAAVQAVFALWGLMALSLGVSVLLLGLLALLRRTGNVSFVANTILGLGGLSLVASVWTQGGLYAPMTPLMATLPLYALVLVGPSAARIWVGVASVVLVLLAVFPETAGPRPEEAYVELLLLNLLVLMGYSYVLVAWQNGRALERESALRDAQRKAEEALSVRSAFLANMGHELRTPMNSVVGLSEGMLVRGTLDIEDRSTAREVLASAQSVVALMDDILLWSSIETGDVALVCSPMSLVGEVEAVYRLHAKKAERRGLSFAVSVAPDADWGCSDALRVRQVVSNLVSNALRFTNEGAVRVTVTRNGDRVQIVVTDTGMGMSADFVRRLGEPFLQVDASRTRRHGGTGLGLSIVYRWVQLLGGKVAVESQPGRGTRFAVEIPYPAAPPPPKTAAPRLDIAPTESKAVAANVPASTRILVAEDNPINQRVLVAQLSLLGLSADVVDDGAAAVDFARTSPPDIILMDLHMPRMDGLESCAVLRRAGYTGTIIAVTASGLPEDRQAAADAGMDAFLLKPVTLASLQSALTVRQLDK